MPNKNTVKEEWDDFAAQVLKPQNVSTKDISEKSSLQIDSFQVRIPYLRE